LVAGSPVTFVPSLGDGVQGGFSSRAGGVSKPPYTSLNLGLGVADDPADVTANRAALAAACGLRPADLTWMQQVHGADVWHASAAAPEPARPVDAVFTDVPGRALCVLVADCVPVLLADPVAGLVGAAHSGRPGLAAGVVPALIEAMAGAGASPARMSAVIGPSVCGRCYEVPAEMRAAVCEVVPEAGCLTSAGTAGLDIAAGVQAQLVAAGIGSISADSRCTRESADLYSYRRDRTTGRFAGLIWLSP
jgi:hypothetical protein